MIDYEHPTTPGVQVGVGVGVAGGGGIGVKAGIELQSPDTSPNFAPSGTVHSRPLCGPTTYQ